MRRSPSLRDPQFRARVIAGYLCDEYGAAAAARILAVTPRQFRHLRARYEAEGANGLVNKLRGRPSNRAIKPAIRAPVIALLHSCYRGFQPSRISRRLKREAGIVLSADTIRAWMVAEGLWKVRTRADKTRRRKFARAEPNVCRQPEPAKPLHQSRPEELPASSDGPLLSRIADWEATEEHFFDIVIAYIAASNRPVPDEELIAHLIRVDPELLQKLALIDAIRARDNALTKRQGTVRGGEVGQ